MSKQEMQTDGSEKPYSIDHYPIFSYAAKPAVYFPVHYFEKGVYTDKEQYLNLDLYEATLNGLNLSDAHRACVAEKKNAVTAVVIVSEDVGAWALERHKGKRRSLWAHLNHRYEANSLQRKSLNERPNGGVEAWGKPTTTPSHEHIPREVRREQRLAKCNRMRTHRPIDLELEAKFAHLRTDAPKLKSLQQNEAWAHEQLKLSNEARIRDKALGFKYRLRMSLNAEVPESAGMVDERKSCFARRDGERKWKVVRFDDVHMAKKVRWADVEHLQELEEELGQPEYGDTSS
ncbi:uncharacterized protein EKO05_0000729 [Ascochyta rabiei]|uniref:Uncharacterized protein n=1 Tax=Didymella rabiei TaxID=5454 RepID=A0A163B349_DIDRA|nr:uncharacterized protein EKO05_0000729 [Ascochyta rabiei]KZM21548.1 hypothetical protein ST47_g7302 [Ascochyta rabiei]UPX10057.1 hypothetical protein EKO05_0000729 [Ascochyta rabiei]